MADGSPWQRAKNPLYRLLCGAVILDYGRKSQHISQNWAWDNNTVLYILHFKSDSTLSSKNQFILKFNQIYTIVITQFSSLAPHQTKPLNKHMVDVCCS